MGTKPKFLRGLTQLCRRLGGRLSIVSQEKFDCLFRVDNAYKQGYIEAPFTSGHGLHWEREVVFAVRGREEVGSIIHEMGHVFAGRYPPNGKVHEWDWFGWEIAVARKIGAFQVWSRHNKHYATDTSDWGHLTRSHKRKVVAERLEHAKRIGALDEDLQPRSRRT